MTQQVATPPFQMDIRIAASPVVGMRFLLDGRAADLDAVSSTLEELASAAIEERAVVRARLRRNEDQRRALLGQLTPARVPALESCCSEAFTLCAELGAVEERINGLRLRIEGLRQEAGGLRRLSKQLTTLGEAEMEIDWDATRYRRAVRQLERWVEADRGQIIQTVSDGALQHLDAAAAGAEVVAKRVASRRAHAADADFARCVEAVVTAREELAGIIEDLQPPAIGEGLIASLRRVSEGLGTEAGRLVVFGEPRRLPAAVELALLRIAQEAATNALRHGRATRVDIVLSLHPDRVILVVRDDGDGFDVIATEARQGKTSGRGLIAMRQRAAIENGTLEVRSMVGDGSEVRATFPLR